MNNSSLQINDGWKQGAARLPADGPHAGGSPDNLQLEGGQ